MTRPKNPPADSGADSSVPEGDAETSSGNERNFISGLGAENICERAEERLISDHFQSFLLTLDALLVPV